MNSYKLGNITKKNMLSYLYNSDIKKQKFSFKQLRILCETYPIACYITQYYCCQGEDYNCWIDEDIDWIRAANYSKKTKELNRIIYSSLKKELNKEDLRMHKRNVFVGDNGYKIYFIIPLRDKSLKDICLVFDKKKDFESFDK